MRALALSALVALAACQSTPAPDAPAAPATAAKPDPGSGVVTVDWGTNATAYRGQNGTVVHVNCPPNPSQTAGRSWGTDVYSDDSAMCVAAVHAGAITFAQGGRVAVTIAPGQDSYVASERNGVSSAAWPRWEGSFTVAADG